MPIGRTSVYPRVLALAPGLSPGLLELLQQLDQLGVRQTVLTERIDFFNSRGTFGQRGTVRRTGLPIGKRPAFGRLSAAAHLPVLGRTADLVHVHGGDAATLAPAVAAAGLWDIPLILDIRESDPSAALSEGRPVLQRVLRAALQRSDAFISSSREQAERLVERGAGPERVHILAQAEPAQLAAAVLGLYRVVWASHLAREVAVWHPTAG